MSTGTLNATDPTVVRSPTGRVGGLRRTGLATALFTAPAGLLIVNTMYAWITRNGGSDSTGADALTLAAAHPSAYRYGTLVALIASLLMVPAALGAVRLIGDRAARLGFVGGTLVAAGYICYFAVNLSNFTVLAMAERGGPVGDHAAVVDASRSEAAGIWVFLLFVVGNLIGTFLLGLALLRGHAVPAWAAIGVLAWPPLHVLGLAIGTEWPEVAGALVQAIGFGVVGARLLRRTANG
jgi:hypothetical protein